MSGVLLQHCPVMYRGKHYGCGFGPIHPTRAFLDMGGVCRCGQPFKPYRQPVKPRFVTHATCQVESVVGTHYCSEPATDGMFCKRHRWSNLG